MKNIKPLNTPNFSLILIFGNDAPFVKDCLYSLIQQKFTGLEIICLNLESSDETAQIISSFEKKYVFSYDCLEKDLRPFIEKIIQESLRKAENELNGSTGIDL